MGGVVMRWKSLVVDSIGLFCIAKTTKAASDTGVRRIRQAVAPVLALALLMFALVPAFAADFTEPTNIFRKRCSACHTFGKGVKVGPDLKGVTERRQRDWLLKFVRSSQTVIQSGDPTAKALFDQFKPQKMPDWSDLSDKQISAIMDYFAANGPEIKPADERLADTATPSEIETGRKLFHGETALALGGQSCSSCHAIAGSGFKGGSFGPNLTKTFLKYQDKAMTDFLRRPCFQRVPETEESYLKPEESFALKAYLAESAGIKAHPVQPAPNSKPATGAPNAANSAGSPAASAIVGASPNERTKKSDQAKRGTK
jgi:mono/diheme cytochrome c family protein